MKQRDIIEYLVIFIDEFAKAFGMDSTHAFRYLYRFKALAFLENQYEVAHTLGFPYMVDAMAKFCRKNGGTL